MSRNKSEEAKSFKTAFALIACLFFMWGLSYGLVDVMNKHFQDVMALSKTQAGFTQAAYFGAYFVAAVPAAAFMVRKGYKAGILLGLALYAAGALLFIPAVAAVSYPMFLGAFFILALGLGCLETGANPYASALGDPETSERRLNLSQAFNGIGQFAGPLLGGMVVLGDQAGKNAEALSGVAAQESLAPVRFVYIGVAVVVVLLFVLIALTKLPDLRKKEKDADVAEKEENVPLFRHKEFVLGVAAVFFYMGAQVGLGAFCINLTLETWPEADAQRGAFFLSLGMFCMLVGRFLGTWLMNKFKPYRMLALYGAAAAGLSVVICLGLEWVSMVALMGAFFFMSIMFPTIFALGIKYLGSRTEYGSSFMIMAIVGGAVFPYFMGLIADSSRASLAFILPAICFAMVTAYGMVYAKASEESRQRAEDSE